MKAARTEYLKQLAEFSKIYENIVALKAELDKSQGLERAKLLDKIVEGYQKLGNESKRWPAGERRSSRSIPTTRPG